MSIKSIVRPLVFTLAIAALPDFLTAETLVGSNIDSRVYVAVVVSPVGVQSMMPEGWTSVPFPGGPFEGANLLLSLIDGVLEMSPEGAPLEPASRRAAALVGLGKKDDALRMFVLRVMTTVPERDPYGVASAAEIERTISLSGPANGARVSSDEWRIMPAEGGELSFELKYTTGNRGWNSGESTLHSADDPSFSRIYRYDQLTDLAASTALGRPSSGEFSLSNTVEGLAPIFDGSQNTVAVMDIPVYMRKVYLP